MVERLTKFLSCKHFGEQFDLSDWTIREWIGRGLIESVVIGGRRLIPASECERIAADAIAGRGPLSKHNRGKAAIAAKRAAS